MRVLSPSTLANICFFHSRHHGGWEVISHGFDVCILDDWCYIYLYNFHLHSFLGCCCSIAQSCLTLCNPSTPGLPVPHHLLEFAQVHVHRIGDAVQPSHLLTHSSPSALNLSQHQGFSNVVYICITSICTVSLDKSLCRSFAYFKIKLLVCLLLSCKNSLYILDISPSLIRHMVCKNFLPFHGLSFHFCVCFTLKHGRFKYWWSPSY